ncbi:MAG TPA: aminotransferase class IV [Candidatus Polarisedimenticolia bacterium]|nr:aminotransferase class IV [Candidatus Polarisedimenticolia bacterium]
MDVISVNGRVCPAEEARISPLDRGFLYGDSVYETIRTYNGRPFRLGPHLDRLRRSAEALGIDAARTVVDPGAAVEEALARGGFEESAVRVILSRGQGSLGYDDADCGPPTLVVHVRAFVPIPEAWRREGVDVAVVPVRRNAAAALDPAIKSSNLLNNLLAWRAGRRLGVYEPILLDAAGMLAEGASSNLFLVREGRVSTPALAVGLLRGITREAVLELARAHDLPAAEEVLPAAALASADEAFLTSTLKGVLPIRRVDGWPIRDGRPGPVTRRLADLYDALAQEETKAGSAPGASRRER